MSEYTRFGNWEEIDTIRDELNFKMALKEHNSSRIIIISIMKLQVFKLLFFFYIETFIDLFFAKIVKYTSNSGLLKSPFVYEYTNIYFFKRLNELFLI